MTQIIFVDPDKHCRFCKSTGVEDDGVYCTFCARGQALMFKASQPEPKRNVFANMEPLPGVSWQHHDDRSNDRSA